ncbi:MAG TPA: hypothetical protein VMN58_13220 [Acidimicrobiales bacterium]|nr:hypothetical protein [Acidimicrobiales bacterium]
MSDAPAPPSALAALAMTLDDEAATGGIGPPPLLVRAEGPVGDHELAVRPLEAHPGELLLGFAAPPTWTILGVVVEGWAASVDTRPGGLAGCRPSLAPDRRRVRTTHLVASDGTEAGVVSVVGDEPVVVGAAEGLVPDVLRRCFGLATPTPEVSVAAHFSVHWLAQVRHHLLVQHGRATWGALQRLHPAVQLLQTDPKHRHADLSSAAQALHTVCPWDKLRWLVIERSWLGTGVDPTVAAWMDEGAFARHVLTSQPSVGDVATEVMPMLSPSLARRVRAALRSWEVLPAARQAGDAA